MLIYKGYRIALGALPYVPGTDRAWMPVADIWVDDGRGGNGQDGRTGHDGSDGGNGRHKADDRHGRSGDEGDGRHAHDETYGSDGHSGADGGDGHNGTDGGDGDGSTAPIHFAWSVLACATVDEAKSTAEVLVRSAIDKGLTTAPYARRPVPANAEDGARAPESPPPSAD